MKAPSSSSHENLGTPKAAETPEDGCSSEEDPDESLQLDFLDHVSLEANSVRYGGFKFGTVLVCNVFFFLE
jgi:hypothetical protein